MPGLLTVGVPYVTEAFTARIGERAMGYYVAALVGGRPGRAGRRSRSSPRWLGWRVALAALALLPLSSTIVMRRSLPPEPEAPARTGWTGAKLAALLRNRTLMAATLVGSAMFFTSWARSRTSTTAWSARRSRSSPATAGLIFVLWLAGGIGPSAGRLAGRAGWARVAFGARRPFAALGLTVSLTSALAVVVVGLALVTLGNFSGVTATQIGVGASTDQDRGVASALYFSSYYLAGALGVLAAGARVGALGVARRGWARAGRLRAGADRPGAQRPTNVRRVRSRHTKRSARRVAAELAPAQGEARLRRVLGSGALAVGGARAVALALLGSHLAHDQRPPLHLLLDLLELLAALLVVSFALGLHDVTPSSLVSGGGRNRIQ